MELIDQEKYDKPQLFKFQRAARTDKGVSALRQIVSCNFPENFPENVERINENLPDEIRLLSAQRTIPTFDSRNFVDFRTYSYTFPTFAISPPGKLLSTYYRVDSQLIDRCNELLLMYKGTHNFHNFTSGKAPSDNSSMRYIIDISCSPPFQYEEMEFAKITVRGQSFMLHQIRKMIGLVFAIMRGYGDQGKIERSFLGEKQDIPIAPSLGLLLECVHYDTYNRKHTGEGTREPLHWDEHNQTIEDFKHKFIFSNIYKQEKQTFSMISWLDMMHKHAPYMMKDEKLTDEQQGESKDEQATNGEATNGAVANKEESNEETANESNEVGESSNGDDVAVDQAVNVESTAESAESKSEVDSKIVENGISGDSEDIKLRN